MYLLNKLGQLHEKGTAETQRTQSKILFPLQLRGRQMKINFFPGG